MKTDPSGQDGRTFPYWFENVEVPTYPSLTTNRECDVCVIGAGIAGLSTAYHLLKAGRKVIVLNQNAIGDGQTGRTSAHLASAIDDRFVEIVRQHGADAAKLAYESHAAGIDSIESIAREANIDCDFARLDGYLFAAPDEGPKLLDEEFEAAKESGAAVRWETRAPLGEFDTGRAIVFRSQARFHPMKYLAGLARAIEAMGGEIFTGHRVVDVQGNDAKTNERAHATTQWEKTVHADALVVATNAPAPINDWAGVYTKQASYRTYVVALALPRGAVADALFWDTGGSNEGYHYVRVEQSEAGDLLIVGGQDHKVGQMDNLPGPPFELLERWARERVPACGEVKWRWSGQVQEPVDGLAYIGKAPHKKPGVYVITGDSGMGLTHGALGAMLVTDLIMKRANPWAEIYDPSRKPTRALGRFLSENLNAVKTYGEYVTPGEVAENQIANDEGAVVRSGLKKLAVYRDREGCVHRMSAVCPHLGCIVHWNTIEKSWDCPCHGSRFTAKGQPVMGPAVSELSQKY